MHRLLHRLLVGVSPATCPLRPVQALLTLSQRVLFVSPGCQVILAPAVAVHVSLSSPSHRRCLAVAVLGSQTALAATDPTLLFRQRMNLLGSRSVLPMCSCAGLLPKLLAIRAPVAASPCPNLSPVQDRRRWTTPGVDSYVYMDAFASEDDCPSRLLIKENKDAGLPIHFRTLTYMHMLTSLSHMINISCTKIKTRGILFQVLHFFFPIN